MNKFIFGVAIWLFAASGAQAQGVAVTIKPLHSLVAAVMEGDGQIPLLLVDGKQSLHNFSLKPSQVKALQDASIVFYMSDDFEMFMQKTLASLPESVIRASVGNLVGISRLPMRQGNGFELHEHEGHEEHEHRHDHDAPSTDFHLWTSPANAKTMAMEIARQLAIAFPEKRSLYFANLKRLGLKLDVLDRSLEQRMARLQGRPFIAFHDAYQYFQMRYGLAMAGAITLHPERGISAKRMSDLREKIHASKVTCVFREPQFDAKAVDNILEGTQAKSAVIDPEGALLTPGPELYFQMMEGMATAFEQCLG